MAVSRIDAMWNMMRKTKLEVDIDTINNDFFCKICNNLIINAHEVSCGCICCWDCVTQYIAEKTEDCPGKREDHIIKEFKTSINDSVNLKITRLMAKCPNEGCTAKLELFEMPKHLTVCPKQVIPCPYSAVGCRHEQAERRLIEAHLRDDSIRHTQLLMVIMTEMDGEVRKMKADLRTSRDEVAALREETRTKDLQLEGIVVQMAEQKKELAAVRETSRNQDLRITILEEELLEVRSQMESRLSFMRGNSAA